MLVASDFKMRDQFGIVYMLVKMINPQAFKKARLV